MNFNKIHDTDGKAAIPPLESEIDTAVVAVT